MSKAWDIVEGLISVAQVVVKAIRNGDEEKVDGRRTIQRLARGVVEKTISQSDLEQISDGVTEIGPDGNQKMKESISDEELRTLLADAKQLADDNEIPDEEFVVDLAGEVRKMVDVLLGE